MSILENYEPKCFFKWFEALTRIPRITFHEEKVTDFIEDYAIKHQFRYVRDPHNNIILYVPASSGYENEPSMLLQSHTDMVAAKDEGVDFDFEKDPIKLRIIEGNRLMGTGTTLGADDGSGVAAMLAIGDTPDVKHAALEMLFTSSEESGFFGIRRFDFEKVMSHRMINFDSGRVHDIGVSSVGSINIEISETLNTEPVSGSILCVHIWNGKNGHVGLDAFRNRACTANVIGRMLHSLMKNFPVRLVSFETMQPGIISECAACIAVPEEKTQDTVVLLKNIFAKINVLYQDTDPELRIEVTEKNRNSEKSALSEKDSRRVIDLLCLLETGTRKSHPEDRNYLLASSSLYNIRFDGTKLYALYIVLSGEDSYRDYLSDNVMEIMHLLGFNGKIVNSYSGWVMKKGSKMIELFDRKHEELFGYKAGHRHIHGGIELGMITGAIPEMDAVAVIPTMSGAHTTNETLYIDEVSDFWSLLTAVLAEKQAPKV